MRKKLLPVLLCLAVAGTSAGCFGKFALTRKIYGFNETVSGDRVVRSIMTWVLVIVPVYELGALVDFLFLNTVEFWTGSNPVAANDRCDGKAPLAVTEQPDGSARAECGDASYRLVPSGAGTFALERDGALVGTAETTEDGGLLVMGADGHVIGALSPTEVEERAAESTQLAGIR